MEKVQKRSTARECLSLLDKKVKLAGWVAARRNHGQVVFLDLRDRSGLIQIVADKSVTVKVEDVVEVVGSVCQRPEALINPKLETGTIEVAADEVTLISPAQTLPFPIDTSGHEVGEEIRLEHRYLDLRRPRMQRNLRVKAQVTSFIRKYLNQQDFVEIDTPILTKTTPEGARDFLVPSRLQPGKFYALPQSPQQYKQLLMVAGFERYYQFARCFRDEDPRADRAYGEFTQLDMELSFVTQEDILVLIETMFTKLIAEIFPDKYILHSPWPRLSHKEAMSKYGTDKPDLRKNKDDPNELAFAWTLDFPLFTEQSEDDFFHGSGNARFAPSHHMFTAPHPDDVPLLDTDPTRVRGLQHDLVLNGFEVGGGSIRIHDAHIQKKVFELIGFSKDQQAQFAHMLKAFSYGVPPHGGIAPGLDRLMMVLMNEPNLREVIAFPANSSGKTAVMSAPSSITENQRKELGLVSAKNNLSSSPQSQLLSKLDNLNIAYQLITHEPVTTYQEAERIEETKDATGVKAMVLLVDGRPAMLAVPSNDKINFKAVKQALQAKSVKLASLEQAEAITKIERGGIHPLGSLYQIPTYADSSLEKTKLVSFNAASKDQSLILSTKDYIRAEQPTLIALE